MTLHGWWTDFSHEIVETLVEPVNAHYIRDLVSNQLEVADPVGMAHQLRRVHVSDFVRLGLPARRTGDFFADAGAHYGPDR